MANQPLDLPRNSRHRASASWSHGAVRPGDECAIVEQGEVRIAADADLRHAASMRCGGRGRPAIGDAVDERHVAVVVGREVAARTSAAASGPDASVPRQAQRQTIVRVASCSASAAKARRRRRSPRRSAGVRCAPVRAPSHIGQARMSVELAARQVAPSEGRARANGLDLGVCVGRRRDDRARASPTIRPSHTTTAP